MNTFLENLETFNEIDYFRTFKFFLLYNFIFLSQVCLFRKSISISNKSHISNVLPLLSLITFLYFDCKIFTCASLGLVGALSIVRFRTPIKEPEELIYLFLAISID